MIESIRKDSDRGRTNRRMRHARTWRERAHHEQEHRYRAAKRTLTFTDTEQDRFGDEA
jgi:hypothetical protein